MTCHYTGIADDMLRFVQEKQLKDRTLWALVADQFAGAVDDADLGWRGEYWGKLMRGACMTWTYTRDEALYQILSEAVDRLLAHQDLDGRIATYSREKEFQGWDLWCRKYVLLGLWHFYGICADPKQQQRIVQAACRQLDYIVAHVGPGENQVRITKTSTHWRGINSSSILEPVVRWYRETGIQAYLDFATYILSEGGADGFSIFEAAYEDRLYPYEYPVVKAYELMSCFEGLGEYAQATGTEKWAQAVVRFADKLLLSEKTIVGGSGCKHELFNHSTVAQSDAGYDGLMLETCVTVTWMKLMYRVYLMTGDPRYLDELEVSAFNALYGAVNTGGSTCGGEATFDKACYRAVYDTCIAAKGGAGQVFDSYSPLRAGIRGRAVGGFKSMRQDTQFFGCCIAIGAAGTALVPMASARAQENRVEIGLYLPGTVSFELTHPETQQQSPVALKIETAYPADGHVKIRVACAGQDPGLPFELALRIPAFARHSHAWLNGTALQNVEAGAFLSISRQWKNGDEIELALDMNPRVVWAAGEQPAYAAVLYGPLALARDRRMGPVATPVSFTDAVSVKRLANEAVSFPCQGVFEVNTGTQRLQMVDYASAGKTWRRDSEMEAWLPL